MSYSSLSSQVLDLLLRSHFRSNYCLRYSQFPLSGPKSTLTILLLLDYRVAIRLAGNPNRCSLLVSCLSVAAVAETETDSDLVDATDSSSSLELSSSSCSSLSRRCCSSFLLLLLRLHSLVLFRVRLSSKRPPLPVVVAAAAVEIVDRSETDLDLRQEENLDLNPPEKRSHSR